MENAQIVGHITIAVVKISEARKQLQSAATELKTAIDNVNDKDTKIKLTLQHREVIKSIETLSNITGPLVF